MGAGNGQVARIDFLRLMGAEGSFRGGDALLLKGALPSYISSGMLEMARRRRSQ